MRRSITIFLLIFMAPEVVAQVGINTPLPEESSSLELKTNERGFLPTRMSRADRENMVNLHGALPAGIFIYDTDDQTVYFYNPANGDGNNAGGDENWQALLPVAYNDNKSDFRSSNYMRTAETHRTVKNVNLFTGNLISDIRRLFIKGNMSISSTNDNNIPPADYGLHAEGNSSFGNNVNITNKLEAGSLEGLAIIPIGGIILWSGNAGNVPSGWVICNSSNTPDMVGRMALGAGGSEISSGGSKSQTLTTSQLPSHSHSLSGLTLNINSGGAHTHSTNAPDHYSDDDGGDDEYAGADGVARRDVLGSAGNHTHSISVNQPTAESGLGAPIETLPPYVALFYIKRVF